MFLLVNSAVKGPKPAEKFVSERCGDGRSGERSNKSEDELFTDAVTEFTDTSGFIPANEERLEDATPVDSKVEKITARHLTMFYSFKDNAVAGKILKGLDNLLILALCFVFKLIFY